MQEQPSRKRRPWWMHVLLSPWYLVRFLERIIDFGENLFYLIAFLAILVLVAVVAFAFVWGLFF